MQRCVDKEANGKTSDLTVFHIEETHSFDINFTGKRVLQRKSQPNYRLINRYFKSSQQYQKERKRRRRIRELSEQGYTLQQIAKELKVSYRTVRRDTKKIERYVRGQFRKHIRKLVAEQQADIEKMVSEIPLKEQMNRLSRLMAATHRAKKLSEAEIFKCHNNVIYINLDQLNAQGFPTINCSWTGTTFKTPYKMSMVAIKNGEKHILGGVSIG